MARTVNPAVTPLFITRAKKAQARIEVIRDGLYDVYWKLEEAAFRGERDPEESEKSLDQAEARWTSLYHELEQSMDLLAGLDSISYAAAVAEHKGERLRKGILILKARGREGSARYVEQVLHSGTAADALVELEKCLKAMEEEDAEAKAEGGETK